MIIRFFSNIIKAVRIAWNIIVFGTRTILLPNTKRDAKFYIYAKKWGQKLLNIVSAKMKIIGLENIDPHQSYIFVANHSNLFDIPIMQASIPNDFRIIYKQELEKIPFFGLVMKKSPYISTRRDASKSTMGSIDKALSQVRRGASVLVFPEGTRSKDGSLSSFKRGAFLLAFHSGKPIVPITIIGSNKIFPNNKFEFNPARIRVIIDKPIEVNDLQSKSDELKLMDNIHSIMEENLKYRGVNAI